MSMTRELRLHATAAAAVTALALLAGCDQSGPQMRGDTCPMGQAARLGQPPPDKPLFGSSDYLRAHDVLPPAKVDIREPLPAMAAAQPVVQPQASTAEPGAQQGGVTPAAGMAAGITNAQGDGEKHKLDGGTVK